MEAQDSSRGQKQQPRMRITIEDGFNRAGGVGKFQKISCLMNTLANCGAMFFLHSFAFLEREPNFKCQLTPGSSEWTLGTPDQPLEEEYCAANHVCEIDWSDPQSINNLIAQFNFFC